METFEKLAMGSWKKRQLANAGVGSTKSDGSGAKALIVNCRLGHSTS